MNYQIFYYAKHHDFIPAMTVIHFVENFLGTKPNYQKYNDMTGCLVLCAKEIKRRLDKNADILYQILDHYDAEIARYEDKKCSDNGDVE